MAFKKKIKLGKTELDTVCRIINLKMSSIKMPITAEIQVFTDEETYREIQDQERGFLINEDGTPKLNEQGKKIGVTVKHLDYSKTALLRTESINSRNIGTEKDMAFRKEIIDVVYKYFGEGEKI